MNEVGEITQRELTERIGVQPGSASEVIAKLESAELIVRTQNPVDRRTTDIRLTDKGRTLASETAGSVSSGTEKCFPACRKAKNKSCCFLWKRSMPIGNYVILRKTRRNKYVEIHKELPALCRYRRFVYGRRSADGFDTAGADEPNCG